MAQLYSPQSVGVKPPAGGFKEGGWYAGRQYWGGTLSEPGVIHPSSNQKGAGQLVSAEVNLQSDAAQGNNPGDIEKFLAQQRQKSQNVQPTGLVAPRAPSTSSAGFAGTGDGAGVGVPQQETLNLPELYKGLYQSEGIDALQSELSEMEKGYIDAQGSINDNPFLSEATRVGRIEKLSQQYEQRTANKRNELAMKKADIETQLNLQLKQFDINSQAQRQAMDQFNTLLQLGALDNANGEDIANITRSTGIPSSMIQSAIGRTKEKDRKTAMSTFTDNSGVVTAVVLDAETGEIISQQSLGAIAGAKTGGGGREPTQYEQQRELQSQMVRGLEMKKNSYGHVSPQDWQGALSSWLARGGSYNDFIQNFAHYADPNRGDFDQAYFPGGGKVNSSGVT